MSDFYRRLEGYEDVKRLLDASDEQVLANLGKPTLIRIPGTDGSPRARFISCLLHGNEDSGYHAVLELLRTGARYPFDLWIFIGNVAAASRDGWFAHRYLDGEEDFNRVWGREDPTTPMRVIADAVVAELGAADLDATVDLHNNTGENPYYAVLPNRTDAAVALALTCVDRIVEWRLRAYSLIEQFSLRCPTVAVECGLPLRPRNHAFALGVLHRFLAAPSFERTEAVPLALLRLAYRVSVRPEVEFTFDSALDNGYELALRPGLDGQNFGMLLAGTELGKVREGAPVPLEALDLSGHDVTQRLFEIRPGGRLVIREDVTPVMMTRNALQTRRDCLFYVGRHLAV